MRHDRADEELRARITERNRARHDPSEADLDVLGWQSARAEPPTANEGVDVIPVDTVRLDALELSLRSIGGVPSARSDQL